MIVGRIQKDLIDFIKHDPDDADGLIEFWYSANSEALSAALTGNTGQQVMINVSSFDSFSEWSKKLFLIADTLILRDTRTWAPEENEFGFIPLPKDQYTPGFLTDVIDQLEKLRPSPLTLLYKPQLYWTSNTKILNNGLDIAYAGWEFNQIPKVFKEWIKGVGLKYLESGSIVYAPFVPSMEIELEFLKNNVSLPNQFGSVPFFHEKFTPLESQAIQALLRIQVPFLHNLDIETIAKVKQDNYDEFGNFSRAMLGAITKIKSSLGSDDFAKDVRDIQRDILDDGLSKIQQKTKAISNMSFARKSGITVGLVGLDAIAFMGVPLTTIVSGLARIMHERALFEPLEALTDF